MILRLITYDIEDNRYRHKLAKKLEAFGFIRVQYSVFCGTHTVTQWERCWEALQKIHCQYGCETDKIYVIIVSKKMFRAMQRIGPAPATGMILSEEITMWV